MKKLSLVLFMVVFAVGFALAQRTVMGSITDSNGDALIGASVLVKGTTKGTVTDLDGKYSVEVPAGANMLVISYTGYESQEIELGASNVVNITMSEGVTLETAVVTALGVKREEKALGYAVQNVDGAEVLKANTVSMLDALTGKAAGLQITQASGAAGAASRVILRGQTSLNGDNEALIVVDGVRINNSENHSERSLGGVAVSNRAMDINPNDIENVTVLKGAAATALYGYEGARGVIVITTKKGKSGKGLNLEYNTTYTVSQVNALPKFQDQFTQGSGGRWQGPETGQSGSWGAKVDTLYWDGATDYAFDKNGRIVGESSPNKKTKFEAYKPAEDFYVNGNTWSNNLSMSGGNEVTTYRFSFGHLNQNGIVPKNDFKRLNLGVAGSSSFFDKKLEARTSVTYTKSGGRRIQQGSNISGLNLGLYRSPISFDNGNGSDDPANDRTAYYQANGRQRNYRGGGGYDNPYWVINNSPFRDDVNRMLGNLGLSWTFNNWAVLGANLGVDFYSDIRKQSFEINSRAFPAGRIIDDQYFNRQLDNYITLSGNGQMSDDFTLGYNLGLNLFQSYNKNLRTQGDGLNFPGFMELANVSSISTVNTILEEKTLGAFGSLDFGFRNFLYLTLTGRQDYISTLIVPSREFNAGDIGIFYPSASLSFVFSELMEADWLSFGKARLSFAQVGGGAPDPYLTGDTWIAAAQTGFLYSIGDGWTDGVTTPFNGTPGYTLTPVKGSTELTPSLTTDLEFGLDLRFWNNRLGIDATYYQRNSDDQILTVPVANSSGYQRLVLNSGSLKTLGSEVVLSLTPVKTRNFSWDMAVNFSQWNTTVERLAEGVPNQYIDGFTGSAVYNLAPEADGTKYEYGQIFGGAFQHANTPDGRGFDPDLEYNPDGALIIDDDPTSANYGFPLQDPIERVLGNPNPDFLLGINNTLTYKGLSLSFLFDIKQGGDMWNGTEGALVFFGMAEQTEDRGTSKVFEGIKSSDGNANDISVTVGQGWYQGNGGGFGAVAEHFIQDASSYRLRQLVLAYDFNKDWFKNSAIGGLTVSFTGRNLWLSSPYNGIDPETSLVGSGSDGQGLDYFQMPGTKSYAIGLNVKF